MKSLPIFTLALGAAMLPSCQMDPPQAATMSPVSEQTRLADSIASLRADIQLLQQDVRELQASVQSNSPNGTKVDVLVMLRGELEKELEQLRGRYREDNYRIQGKLKEFAEIEALLYDQLRKVD